MGKNHVVIGPWGGHDAQNMWSYEPKGAISRISITYDDAIYSIRFASEDEKGKVHQSKKFGEMSGAESSEVGIDVKNGERLNYISGTSDVKDGHVIITSLAFYTNKKKILGPFGEPRGDAFSFHVLDDEIITGFHGRSGYWLDAIGVYLQPKTKVRVARWGAQDPGNEWSYEPKGVISHISITHEDAIYSISFTSKDAEGNEDHSNTFGQMTGSKSNEIDIDIKNEKLNYISGTYAIKDGYVVVTSLSFSTDKNKVFGPFGEVRGTAFSCLVSDRGFAGFHGRAGYWLDAIGVYLEPPPNVEAAHVGVFKGKRKQWGCCLVIILLLLICVVIWIAFPPNKKRNLAHQLFDHIPSSNADFSIMNYGVFNGFRGRFGSHQA